MPSEGLNLVPFCIPLSPSPKKNTPLSHVLSCVLSSVYWMIANCDWSFALDFVDPTSDVPFFLLEGSRGLSLLPFPHLVLANRAEWWPEPEWLCRDFRKTLNLSFAIPRRAAPPVPLPCRAGTLVKVRRGQAGCVSQVCRAQGSAPAWIWRWIWWQGYVPVDRPDSLPPPLFLRGREIIFFKGILF